MPTPLRADVGLLKGLVGTQPRSGELAWQPAPVAVQQYEAQLDLWHQEDASRSSPRPSTSTAPWWRDGSNVWMRRINPQLGFVPVESEVILHRQR